MTSAGEIHDAASRAPGDDGVLASAVGETDADSVLVQLYDPCARVGYPAGDLGAEVEIIVRNYDPEMPAQVIRFDVALAREVFLALAAVLTDKALG